MRKLVVVLGSIILSTLIFPYEAKARPLNPSLGPYMTDEGSTVQKDTFGWNETPNAFIQFDLNDLNLSKPLFMRWTWRFKDDHFVSHESEEITDFSNNPLNIWNSLDDWNLHKKAGEWTVKVAWQNPGSGHGSQKVSFTVTPEPLSSLLFLTGALTLAARRYRKRKEIS